MRKRIKVAIEQIELLVVNNPVMFQQIMDNIDDLLWCVYPLIQLFIQWLTNSLQ